MKPLLLTNARVVTMDEGLEYETGYLLAAGGKIEALGPMASLPEMPEAETVDCGGGVLTPGLIDAHCHVGLFGDSLPGGGGDLNETADPVAPHLRTLDGVNPMDGYFAEAVRAGVTAVAVSPGSANPIGGQIAVLRTAGVCVDDMLLSPCCAVKCALGENPKSSRGREGRSPMTRMAVAAMLREALFLAREYRIARLEGKGIPFNMKWEALLPVLRGEIPLHIHAHQADDIFTALRIGAEFGVRVVPIHATQAHLVAGHPLLEGVPLLLGPVLTDRSKPELSSHTTASAGLLEKAGVRFALISDHPETPVGQLVHSAQVAAMEGLSPGGALAALTATPAALLGLGQRIGRLKKGMDADLAVFSGHPAIPGSRARLTVSRGEVIFRAL